MINFHSGIIRGRIVFGKLHISEEKSNLESENYLVTPEAIGTFLEEHDYRYTYNKKTGTYIFTKNIMDNNLEEILKIKGISKAELGRRIGVDRSLINSLVKSKNMEIDTIYRILTALDMTANEIEIVFPMKNTHLIKN